MNALKHAFPDDKAKGQITVAYDMIGTNWKLSITDNGIGKPAGGFAQGKSGLGTGIVKALAHQLDAQVETLAGPEGTTVSITHATFPDEGRPSRLNGVNRQDRNMLYGVLLSNKLWERLCLKFIAADD